ncbi:MAG: transglycosylase SLT domain-containing protein [Limimaricola soesokkakensis]|uniref:transglycosylase SLT domain-containing protein n=1 Tax=Limimaricola soesokkakensis TaxID=1343159 RepID=UPI004057F702
MLVALMILGGSMAVMPGSMVHAEPSDPAQILAASIEMRDDADEPPQDTPVPPQAGPEPPHRALSTMIAPELQADPRPEIALRPISRPATLAANAPGGEAGLRPRARDPFLPEARWDGKPGTGIWTRGLMSALRGPASDLAEVVPADIATWCPAYAANPPRLRRAFWVGVMSALARFESRHRADAVGGGGLYHGLLQILPGTARGYGCVARDGAMLRDPVRNLSCAARIMARTVKRDGAVAMKDGRRAGIAADWGPMTKPAMRAEMAAWTREQSYCRSGTLLTVPRPQARPQESSERSGVAS